MYLQNSISGHTSQQQKVGDGGHFNKCNSNVSKFLILTTKAAN